MKNYKITIIDKIRGNREYFKQCKDYDEVLDIAECMTEENHRDYKIEQIVNK